MSQYYGIQRSNEYLAHYGIKGMKWGIRKARQSGDSRALERQYNKAQKKLAKLEKRANNGSKYAKRAAALGAGAAAAGGLAVAGTQGVANAVRGAGKLGTNAVYGIGQGANNVGKFLSKNGPTERIREIGDSMKRATDNGHVADAASRFYEGFGNTGGAIEKWGQGSGKVTNAVKDTAHDVNSKISEWAIENASKKGNSASAASNALKRTDAINKISNDTLARAGAAALGLGLAGAAGYNAYRAATTKRAAKKAEQWRNTMQQELKGTKYDTRKKRRR